MAFSFVSRYATCHDAETKAWTDHTTLTLAYLCQMAWERVLDVVQVLGAVLDVALALGVVGLKQHNKSRKR